MADGKRPFWMHQLVEYILGGALVAAGLQSQTPTVPAVLGGLIMVHAAITRGALAAFRVINRKVHRAIDPFIIGLTIVAAVQPWISIANPTRLTVGAVGAVHFIVYVGSSFHERAKRPKAAAVPSSGDRSTDLGRSAGRVVGSGVNAVRRMRSKDGA
jgi:hypothetical protein